MAILRADSLAAYRGVHNSNCYAWLAVGINAQRVETTHTVEGSLDTAVEMGLQVLYPSKDAGKAERIKVE